MRSGRGGSFGRRTGCDEIIEFGGHFEKATLAQSDSTSSDDKLQVREAIQTTLMQFLVPTRSSSYREMVGFR